MRDCYNCNGAGGMMHVHNWYAVFEPCGDVSCQEASRESANQALADLLERFEISPAELGAF